MSPLSPFVKGSEQWYLRDVLQEAPPVKASSDVLEEKPFIKGSESWFHHFVWGAPEIDDGSYHSDFVEETVAGNGNRQKSPFIKGSEKWFHDDEVAQAEAVNHSKVEHHFVKGSEYWFTNWFVDEVVAEAPADEVVAEAPPVKGGRARYEPNLPSVYETQTLDDETQMLDKAKLSVTKDSPRDRLGSASTAASDSSTPRDDRLGSIDSDDF